VTAGSTRLASSVLSSRRVATTLKVTGVARIGLRVIGTVFLIVAMGQGLSGAPVVGLALSLLGALLSGAGNLSLHRKYSRPTSTDAAKPPSSGPPSPTSTDID